MPSQTVPVLPVLPGPASAVAAPVMGPLAASVPVVRSSGTSTWEAHPNIMAAQGPGGFRPAADSSPIGLTPAQVRGAYGVDSINFSGIVGDGTGQTIAIVDAYDDPTALADLNAFSRRYNLPSLNAGLGTPSFLKRDQNGGTSLPSTDPAGPGGVDWEIEESLDIEWAHAMAPRANISLYEANTPFDDLFTAVASAAKAPNVVAVSMSWGGDESSAGDLSAYDPYFTSPASHGVTFLNAAGDTGAYDSSGTTIGPDYPATSPRVLTVGGTRLSTNGNNYAGETGWGTGSSSGTSSEGGGGGGISQVEAQPSWQKGIVSQSTSFRTYPDVSMDADPVSAVSVYDSYDFGASTPWDAFGGTSLAAPLWSGLIAVADQGRALNGLKSLDGASQTLPKIYQLPASDFHDITTGNNGYAAGPGYDLVTGRGTPIANKLVPDLAGLAQTPIDNLYLKKDADGALDEWVNSPTPGAGTPTETLALADISGITINGAAGGDTVALDYSAGNFASGLKSGITYKGSPTDNNQIEVIGTADDDTLAATSSSLTFSGGLASLPMSIFNVTTISFPGGSGGSDTFNVVGNPPGGYHINADTASGAANVAVHIANAGTLATFDSTQHLASLTIDDGSAATMGASASAGGNVLVTDSLSIASTGKLDLTNNGMIVNYANGVSPISSIASLIQSAYSAGTWTGAGITSTLADGTQHALGYAEASDIAGAAGGTFMGQAVGASAVLIHYTRYGDANLDGQVNFADFVALSNHFGATVASGWDAGDFNYDGTVSFADFVLLSNNFGATA
ncbi:MAG TPA: dockerin type I domain-containing protein [Tepidisphaeraceae bacterium]|nr:dockerin type I domain-containing protein [Tepidisphaeraceae bacterium]